MNYYRNYYFVSSTVGKFSREAWMCNKRNRGRDRSQPRRARVYWWMNRHDRNPNGYSRNRFLRRRGRYVPRESYLINLYLASTPYGSRRKTQNTRSFTRFFSNFIKYAASRATKTRKRIGAHKSRLMTRHMHRDYVKYLTATYIATIGRENNFIIYTVMEL